MIETVFRSWQAVSIHKEILASTADDVDSAEDPIQERGSSEWREQGRISEERSQVISSTQLADEIGRWVVFQLRYLVGIRDGLEQIEFQARMVVEEALANVHRYGFPEQGDIDLTQLRVVAEIRHATDRDTQITLSFFDQGKPLPKPEEDHPLELSHGNGRAILRGFGINEQSRAVDINTKVVSYSLTIPRS